MIELPEAQTLARQLAETLGGKTVRKAVAGAAPHGLAFFNVPQVEFGPMLEGRAVTGAHAFGGHVELALSGGMRLSFHDGANIRYYGAGEQIPAKHQLYVEFDDGSFFACTVSMYAGFSVYEDGTNVNPYYLTAKEKPSPLTAEFDRPCFDAIVEAAGLKVSLKALLAAEQRIPGVGNGCLQDILFTARQNPQTRLAALDAAGMDSVYGALKTTLAAMTMGGGRDTEKDLFGTPGGYRSVLSAKTLAYPCPVCGGPITRKAYMGGNVYFCPVCQPVRK